MSDPTDPLSPERLQRLVDALEGCGQCRWRTLNPDMCRWCQRALAKITDELAWALLARVPGGCGECDCTVPAPAQSLCGTCQRAAVHTVPLSEWEIFLWQFFPEEYRPWRESGLPTPAAPGSRGKVAAMAERVKRGMAPRCNGDAGEIPADIARQIAVLRNGRISQKRIKILLAQFAPVVQEPLIPQEKP